MTAREEAVKVITSANKRMVQVNDKVHVYVYSDAEEAEMLAKVDLLIRHSLNNGKTVKQGDTEQWIEKVAQYNTDETASACFKWHADGNRVRADRIMVTKTPTGIVREKIGECWVKI